jgi:hypothetical protein
VRSWREKRATRSRELGALATGPPSPRVLQGLASPSKRSGCGASLNQIETSAGKWTGLVNCCRDLVRCRGIVLCCSRAHEHTPKDRALSWCDLSSATLKKNPSWDHKNLIRLFGLERCPICDETSRSRRACGGMPKTP